MQNKINISVVILTYNESSSIEKTLNSITNNFNEIIILDSYSVDNTIKICSKYTNKIYYFNGIFNMYQ